MTTPFQRYLYQARQRFPNSTERLWVPWAEAMAHIERYGDDPRTVIKDGEPVVDGDRLVRTPYYQTYLQALGTV